MTEEPADLSATWGALLKVHAALVPRLDRELQDAHGLPLTWYDVLLELNAAPDRRLTMGALGSVAAVSRTRVSRVVDELTRAGLVTREPNPDDRRSAFAALTPAGRGALRKAAPTYLAAVRREFADHLTPQEADVLARALRKVLAAATGGEPVASAEKGAPPSAGPRQARGDG
jgi:DNA-binding MarR family transcriptional regulator